LLLNLSVKKHARYLGLSTDQTGRLHSCEKELRQLLANKSRQQMATDNCKQCSYI